MSNYPDSVSPADPDAPWNQPAESKEPRWFLFDPAIESLAIKATSKEEAIEKLDALLRTDDPNVECYYNADKIKEQDDAAANFYDERREEWAYFANER
jgi:hypothetical protein